MRRETLGDRHPNTLISMNNLGRLYEAQGRLDEAAPLYAECLRVRRETLGDRHPSTLNSMTNMERLYQAQGRLHVAARSTRRVKVKARLPQGSS